MATARKQILGAIAVVAVATAGCGGTPDGPANAVPPPKATVVLGAGEYRPARIEVAAGTRVTWVNGSNKQNTVETAGVGFFEHDREAMARRGVFDLHILSPGEAESLVLERPGTYRYTSSLDGEMVGVVRVLPRTRP